MLLLSSPKTIPKSSTDRPQSRIITRSYTLDDQSFEDYPHFSPKIVRRSSVRSSRSSERDHRLPELEPIDAKKHQHRHHHLNHASDNPTAPSITPDVLPRNTPSRRKRRPSTSSVTSTASSALLPTPTSSYFAPQPESLGLEVRSPFSKRAPASRSSHGIETSSGPPPALSTQRSYTAEASRNGYVSTQQQPLNPRTEAGTLLVNANGIGSGDCGFECREIAKPNCEGSVDASSRQRSFSIGQPINRMDRTRVDAWARDDGDATIRGIDSVGRGKYGMNGVGMLKLETT
ncbi:MAG: hypothetical protein M1812_002649 [Candelaria pacifica]|nr:MAG: hypothetical protein M1812_002649 [Candelaria pacifica]